MVLGKFHNLSVPLRYCFQKGVLVWVLPEADPETKIAIQVLYLGDVPRKHW